MFPGQSKSSPEVWAAVKILSQFLERERGQTGAGPDLPGRVVTSIIHLTQFLQTEGRPTALSDTQTRLREQLEAQERKKKERISQILRAQSSVEKFMMTEAAPLDPLALRDGRASRTSELIRTMGVLFKEN